jgi:PBSX family phage terminase large subunit
MTKHVNVEINGAPWLLLNELLSYQGEERVLEFLIDGPRGTGKTVGVGWVMRTLAKKYPGIRMLYVRKTRRSITQAFCPDFENIILEHEPEVKAGASAANRQEYEWVKHGNAVLVLGGLDDPRKLYSTNWDVVVVDEATQLTETEFAEFRGCLRQFTRGMKFQLLLALTNPRHKKHWLLRRVERGSMKRLRSFLWDNPKWYDRLKKEWTSKGKAFWNSLQQLGGVLFKRNGLGEWCSAEGAVWENWDEDLHMADKGPNPDDVRWACAAMDWGHSDACVLMVAQMDKNGRVWIVREVYRAKMSIAWWTQEVVAAVRDYGIRAIVVDPSRPEIIEHFNTELLRNFPSIVKPLAHKAVNTRTTSPGGDLAGLDLVRHYFEKRRIVLTRDRLRHHPCPVLVEKQRALSFEDEVPDYVYWRPADDENADDARDRTDPACDDHACDTLRYLTTFVHHHDLGDPVPDDKPKTDPNQLALMRAMGLV